MTRLTLYWHLRNIVAGVPERKAIPIEKDEFGVSKWEYTKNYATTGSGEYAKKNGCVNIFYDKNLAIDTLNSSDSVAYLDSIANDPCVPIETRIDASELLSHHIMERRLICTEERRSIMDNMRNLFVQARINNNISKKSMQSDYWNIVSCSNCFEQECLFDMDKPSEPNHCLNCGELIPIPNYPSQK